MLNKYSVGDVVVTGDNYPATNDKQIAAKAVAFIQMLLMAIVIAGETICKTLGI